MSLFMSMRASAKISYFDFVFEEIKTLNLFSTIIEMGYSKLMLSLMNNIYPDASTDTILVNYY